MTHQNSVLTDIITEVTFKRQLTLKIFLSGPIHHLSRLALKSMASLAQIGVQVPC